eukprot:UN00591
MKEAAEQSFLDGTSPAFRFRGTYFGQFKGFFIDEIHSGNGFVANDCNTFPVNCVYWQLRKNDVVADFGVSVYRI